MAVAVQCGKQGAHRVERLHCSVHGMMVLRPRWRLLREQRQGLGRPSRRSCSSLGGRRLGSLHLRNSSASCGGLRCWWVAGVCASWLLGQLGHGLLVHAPADIVSAAIGGLRRGGRGSSSGSSTGCSRSGDIVNG